MNAEILEYNLQLDKQAELESVLSALNEISPFSSEMKSAIQ